MRHYEARSGIAASPEPVWSVLTDDANWVAVGLRVDAVEGRIAPGETVKIRSQAAPGRAFPAKVTAFEPPLRLALQFAEGLKRRVESGG